jgi:ATP-dependent DNA helicase RecG
MWSDEEILADRHLGSLNTKGAFTPSVALVLLAAKDPAKTIPGCRIRIQRFATTEEGSGSSYNPIRERYVEGNVVKLITEAAAVIEDFIYDVTWLSRDGRFVTTKEYPRWAWLECLVNACVHRSYSFSGTEITVKLFPDRMEVESPGGFVPPVNEDTIYFTRAARNHHLMDALRHLGYVRMAREGTRRIRDSMKEWDLPDPTFRQEALHGVVVRVTLRNDHESRKRATDRDVAQFVGVETWRTLQDHEIKIIASVFHNGTIQVSEVQRITGRTWSTSKKDLDRLVRKGLLHFVAGDYPRDPKAHYRLSPTLPGASTSSPGGVA